MSFAHETCWKFIKETFLLSRKSFSSFFVGWIKLWDDFDKWFNFFLALSLKLPHSFTFCAFSGVSKKNRKITQFYTGNFFDEVTKILQPQKIISLAIDTNFVLSFTALPIKGRILGDKKLIKMLLEISVRLYNSKNAH